MIALALKNNNVVVWDWSQGTRVQRIFTNHIIQNTTTLIFDVVGVPRRVVRLSDEGQVFQMTFLDPNITQMHSEAIVTKPTRPYKLCE